MPGLAAFSSLATAVVAYCLLGGIVRGQEMDFRVETDVMVPSQNKPVQQTLTLFRNGVAYDFSRDTPEQIMVIDHERERLALLDSSRQIQTMIDLPGLYAFMESARQQAAEKPGLAVFLEDAQVINVDPATEVIRVGSKVLVYEASVQTPPQPAMAEQYAKFANASAYLNAWRASSPPPFARVTMNGEVQKRGAIPSEITRSSLPLDGSNSGPEQVVKCRLHGSWRLSKDDYQKIDEIDGMLVNFTVVSSTEFLSPGTAAAAGPANTAQRR